MADRRSFKLAWMDRLRIFFAWETVEDTGCWWYQENRITGARRVVRGQALGYQPVDVTWARPPLPAPPGSGEVRDADPFPKLVRSLENVPPRRDRRRDG